MRRAAKVDGNQAEIVEALRAIPGCKVRSLAQLGNDMPDLLVGYRGFNFLVELKNPEYPNGHKERRERQATFRAEWTGQCIVASTVSEIISTMTGWQRPLLVSVNDVLEAGKAGPPVSAI